MFSHSYNYSLPPGGYVNYLYFKLSLFYIKPLLDKSINNNYIERIGTIESYYAIGPLRYSLLFRGFLRESSIAEGAESPLKWRLHLEVPIRARSIEKCAKRD